MAETATLLLIKVKLGDTVRRLKYEYFPHTGNFIPELTFAAFQSGIQQLFELPSSARFSVTFTDNENDAVTVSHDEDVKDVVNLHTACPRRLQMTLLPCGMTSDLGRCGAIEQARFEAVGTDEAFQKLTTAVKCKLDSAKEPMILAIYRYYKQSTEEGRLDSDVALQLMKVVSRNLESMQQQIDSFLHNVLTKEVAKAKFMLRR